MWQLGMGIFLGSTWSLAEHYSEKEDLFINESPNTYWLRIKVLNGVNSQKFGVLDVRDLFGDL